MKKKKGSGKSDGKREKVRGRRQRIIWSVRGEKAPRTLSWVSKHPTPSGVTSLSLKINNQPLPVQQENRWLCTLDYLSVPIHLRRHTQTHTHATNAHSVMQCVYMQSINRNKPTVTVFTKGNSNCAASVQSQPIMGLAVATEQCRPTVET